MGAYFDNAATTYPKPNAVYDYMDKFYRENGGNAGRGLHGCPGGNYTAGGGSVPYGAGHPPWSSWQIPVFFRPWSRG